MATIKAPYNFVPLESEAFYPEWANHISQDIPFEDGVSGSIKYTLTAKTPIFVRNGQAKNTNDNTFSHTADGRYFIPGTSIKGEIRNVLEILSFGKMTQVQDARFGIRDLSQSNEGDRYRSLLKDVKCGWLSIDQTTKRYRIADCGKPCRISPEEIDRIYQSHLYEFDTTLRLGRERQQGDRDDEDYLRSASKKYSILGITENQICQREGAIHNDYTHVLTKFFNINQDKNGRRIAQLVQDDQEGHEGTIVLTGQSSKRMGNKGKYYEFVFLKPNKEIPVAERVVSDFLTIHKNNYDFQHLWKDRLFTKQRIPVFYLCDEKDSVFAIGIAYMFRYPTANFIKGAIPAKLQSQSYLDLAECIFGTIDQNLAPLKGRVFFSHAFAEGEPISLEPVTTTLSSPKPSYGPLYVKDGTWDDTSAVIKGRKRYLIRDSVWSNEQGNENTRSTFIPLASDTKFKGTIFFHNLKKEEFGALLAALTFNDNDDCFHSIEASSPAQPQNRSSNDNNGCFHSIGEAKPLGYGKVKLQIRPNDINIIDNKSEVSAVTALDSFREMMRLFTHDWDNCVSLTQLYCIARGISTIPEEEFKYMIMNTTDRNDFKTAKEQNENLPLFTEIINRQSSTVRCPNNRNHVKTIDDVNREIVACDNKVAIAFATNELPKLISNGRLSEAYLLINKYYDDANEQQKQMLDNLKAEIIYKLDSINAEAKKHMSEGIEYNKQGKFENAKNCLKEAISLFDLYLKGSLESHVLIQPDINTCNSIIQDIEVKLMNREKTLVEFFSSQKLFSTAAFASQLKRWMESCGTVELSEVQITELGQILCKKISEMKKKDKEKWTTRKGWEPIAKVIGKAPTDIIFSAIRV